MTSFAPTLRIDITPAEAEDFGQDPQAVADRMMNDYLDAGLSGSPTFFSPRLTVLADEPFIITNFKAVVVGWFQKDGIFHLNLATGAIIALKFNII